MECALLEPDPSRWTVPLNVFFIDMFNLIHNGGVGGVVCHFHLHQVDLRVRGAQARQLIYAKNYTVLQIRDVYPGSEFFPSRIRIKEFKYFNPKK